MQVVVTLGRQLEDFSQKLKRLGGEGRAELSAGLNAAGAEVRRSTVKAETAQTGLRQGLIDRAQKEHVSTPADLRYDIVSSGGNINLRYFGAKEVPGGVTAHPFGHLTFFPGAFITSGPKGRRIAVAKLNGQVFVNASGAWGGEIEKQASGVFIPKEMTSGQTAETFEASAALAAGHVVTRLGRMMP